MTPFEAALAAGGPLVAAWDINDNRQPCFARRGRHQILDCLRWAATVRDRHANVEAVAIDLDTPRGTVHGYVGNLQIGAQRSEHFWRARQEHGHPIGERRHHDVRPCRATGLNGLEHGLDRDVALREHIAQPNQDLSFAAHDVTLRG